MNILVRLVLASAIVLVPASALAQRPAAPGDCYLLGQTVCLSRSDCLYVPTLAGSHKCVAKPTGAQNPIACGTLGEAACVKRTDCLFDNEVGNCIPR
jgi:hypothetical protein